MGVFKSDDETFWPNCRPVEGSTQDRVILECQPKMSKGGRVFAGDRITQVIITKGEDAVVTDDGGLPDFVLQRLLKHIEENRL